MDSLIYPTIGNINAYTSILFIDKSTPDFQQLLDSVNSSTFPIIYSSNCSKIELLTLIKTNFKSISRIGICFCSLGESQKFLDSENFFNSEKNINNDNVQCIIDIIKLLNVKNIDFLACNTLNFQSWVNYYNLLSTETNVIVGASNDRTGNIKYGGDWVMENTSENIELIYFDKNIEYYRYLLDVVSHFSLMIGTNNEIYGTGTNDNGQLGFSNNDLTQIVIANATVTPKSVFCGQDHTIVLMNNNEIWGCGNNRFGQLGLSSAVQRDTLVKLNISIPYGSTDIVSVACGLNHTMILCNNVVNVCGLNTNGQLGLGNIINKNTFTPVVNNMPSGVNPISVACGNAHSVILFSDFSIYVAGSNNLGQLGITLANGLTQVSNFMLITLPAFVNYNTIKPAEIYCGGWTTMILLNMGRIIVSGKNDTGELGMTDQVHRNNFALVPNLLPSPVIKISCGQTHTALLLSDNSVYFAGSNSMGESGNDWHNIYSSFTQITLPQYAIDLGLYPISIYCGDSVTFLLLNDNTVCSSGNNRNNRLCKRSTIQKSFPFEQSFLPFGVNFSSIASGKNHTIVINDNNQLFSVGDNLLGQTANPSYVYKKIPTPPGLTPLYISSGYRHSLIAFNDGSIYCSGENINRQLGINQDNVDRLTLLPFPTIALNVKPKMIECGYYHTIILFDNGQIFCCGKNQYGQLGLGHTNDMSIFTLINMPPETQSANIKPVSIACGSYFTYILFENGDVYASGLNSSSELGSSGTSCFFSFTKVLFLNQTSMPCEIYCGFNNAMILFKDGSVYASGSNYYNNLGIGTGAAVNTFTRIPNLPSGKTPTYICFGLKHSLILFNDNTIYCCGTNSINELLGTNRTAFSNLNITAAAISDKPLFISCGNLAMATTIICENGSVYSVGENANGQLGFGNTNNITALTKLTNFTAKKAMNNNKKRAILNSFANLSTTNNGYNFNLVPPASSSNGLFTYTNSNSLVASISGSTVTTLQIGTSKIRAIQAETETYYEGYADASLSVTQVNPNLINPTITYPVNIYKNVTDSSFILNPTSNSQGTISFTSSNPSVASISGSTVLILGNGSTTITITQASYMNYLSATFTTTLYVGQIPPTLTNFSIVNANYGDSSFNLTPPFSNSTGGFSYSIFDASVATISGNTVTIVGAGTTSIRATQALFGSYLGATIDTSLNVARINPTITNFYTGIIINKNYGDPSFNLATPFSNSTGAFAYTIFDASVATVLVKDVTIVGDGNTLIRATQLATANYLGGSIDASLNVSKILPTLTNFPNILKLSTDASFILTPPFSNSTGAFNFTSSDATIASIVGSTVTIHGIGNAIITATQSTASGFFSRSISASLNVSNTVQQLMNFNNLTLITITGTYILQSPNPSSAGLVTFSISNVSPVVSPPIATIYGNVLTISGVGSFRVTAIQAAFGAFAATTSYVNVTVNAITPLLTNFSIENKTYGDSSFNLTDPSSNSVGSFNFTSLTPAVASVSGSTVTIIGAGTATIRATQAASGNYSIGQIDTSLNVARLNPIITPRVDFSMNYQDLTYHVSAGITIAASPITMASPVSTSNGSFIFSSSDSNVVNIIGNAIVSLGAGTATITATQQSTLNYNSGFITYSITVIRILQPPTLTNFSIVNKNYGDSSFNLTPPFSNSTGGFSYSIFDASVATISGNTVTIVGAGTTSIRATQALTANYLGGSIDTSLNVAKINPTLTNFYTINKTLSDPSFSLTDPSSNSSGSFAYTIFDASVATVLVKTVTIVGGGNTKIRATQAASANYLGGSIDVSLNVGKILPTLTNFANILKLYSDPSFILTDPSSNSTGAFNFTSSNANIATIVGHTVTIHGVGNVTITATQTATDSYLSHNINLILNVTQTPVIGRSFTDSTAINGPTSFFLQNPASVSNGAIIFTSSDTSIATISGSLITVIKAGTFTITSTQAAYGIYPQIISYVTITVNKINPTLTNFSIINKNYGDNSFNLIDPSSNSDGSFSFVSSNPTVGSISGNIVTIIGLGSCNIRATQSAANLYFSSFIDTSLNVVKTTPTLTNFPNMISYNNDSFNLIDPSSNSDGSFSFVSSNPLVADISGNVVKTVGLGLSTITATQQLTIFYLQGTIQATLNVVDTQHATPTYYINLGETRAVVFSFYDTYVVFILSGYPPSNVYSKIVGRKMLLVFE